MFIKNKKRCNSSRWFKKILLKTNFMHKKLCSSNIQFRCSKTSIFRTKMRRDLKDTKNLWKMNNMQVYEDYWGSRIFISSFTLKQKESFGRNHVYLGNVSKGKTQVFIAY